MSHEPSYCSVEQFQTAADYQPSAHEAARLLRLVDAASRKIELRLHRHFYPLTEAVTYARPRLTKPDTATTTGFFLGRDLLSLDTVTVGGASQDVDTIELWPSQPGEYYSWIGVTGTDIIITAEWGYSDTTVAAGTVYEPVDISETDINVTDSALVGIGDLIFVDDEGMVVIGKVQLDTAQNLQSDLTATTSDTTVAVTDGTAYNASEPILLDAEEMLVLSVSGNNLTVRRAYNGSVLAAHSASDIYAPRTLIVERAAVGTDAATHANSAPITRNLPPGPITDLCIAEALNTYEQETAGYARSVGSGEALREARGHSLKDLRQEVSGYLRPRMAAV